MSAPASQRLALRASALVELATGLALLAVPTVVFDVLIGSPSDSGTTLVARILGGALVALGVAGEMTGPTPERASCSRSSVTTSSPPCSWSWEV